MKYTLITFLSLALLSCSCKKEKLQEEAVSYVIFSNVGETITPLRVYINDQYVGSVTKEKKFLDCKEEVGTLKVKLTPSVQYNLKVFLGGHEFLNEDFMLREDNCMLFDLE